MRKDDLISSWATKVKMLSELPDSGAELISKISQTDLELLLNILLEQLGQELGDNISLCQDKQNGESSEGRRFRDLKAFFLDNLSHELRTPLTTIEGYLSLLRTNKLGELSAKQEKAVDACERQSALLRHKVDDLLDACSLESGDFTMRFSKGSLNDTILIAVSLVKDMFVSKSARVITKLENIPDTRIDSDRILHVICKLLDNAIKFSPFGGEIEINSMVNNNNIQISIHDYGIGIEPGKRDMLFSGFYSQDSTLTRKHGGAGLGLSLSQHIIQAHGGKIWFASDCSVGAKICFEIPILEDFEERNSEG